MTAYTDIRNDAYRLQLNEKEDCAVIALALTTGNSYENVSKLFYGLGRVEGTPSPWHLVQKALFRLLENGFTKSTVRRKDGSQFSAKEIGLAFPAGNYLVSYGNHVAAMINGNIEDWTAGRSDKLVDSIIRIK